MATETLKIMQRSHDQQYTEVFDLNDGVTTLIKSGGIVFTTPQVVPILSSGIDQEGQDSAGLTIPNGVISATLYVTGTDADDLAQNVSNVLQQAYKSGSYLKWQPFGATRAVYYSIAAPNPHDLPYNWLEWGQNRCSLVLNFSVLPYAYGDCMTTLDDFSLDTSANYRLTQGAQLQWDTTNGLLKAIAGDATSKKLWFDTKGYDYEDVELTVKFHTPSTSGGVTAFRLAFGLCGVDPGDGSKPVTYLEAFVTKTQIGLNSIVAGVSTALTDNDSPATGNPVTVTTNLAVDTTYYLRVRREGGFVKAELFSPAGGNGLPSMISQAYKSVRHNLSSAEQTQFPAGMVGISDWTPGLSADVAYLDDFWIKPYTYGNYNYSSLDAWNVPDKRLLKAIPGDVEAEVQAVIGFRNGTVQPDWAAIGWGQPDEYSDGYNLCPQGDMEQSGLVGAGLVWNGDNLSTIGTNGATVTSDNSHQNTGTRCLSVVGAANTTSGAETQVFKRFRRGVAYTFSAWVKVTSTSGTPKAKIQVKAVDGEAAIVATSTDTTLTTSYQQITVTWTPKQDAKSVFLRVTSTVASKTIYVDDVTAYKGAILVSATPQPVIPWGYIHPGWAVAATDSHQGITGWALQTDGTPYATQYLGYSGDVADSMTAAFVINPGAVEPGFMQVWALMRLNADLTNPNVILSIEDEHGYANPYYSTEYGQSGKPLVVPASGTKVKWEYLGAVYLGIPEQSRYLLKITATPGSGSDGNMGLDALFCMPAGRSAMRRWDVSPSAGDGFVPFHSNVSGEAWVQSDLRENIIGDGVSANQEYPNSFGFPAGPWVGSRLRFPVGDVSVLHHMTEIVPGSLSAASVTDNTRYGSAIHFIVTPRYHFAAGS